MMIRTGLQDLPLYYANVNSRFIITYDIAHTGAIKKTSSPSAAPPESLTNGFRQRDPRRYYQPSATLERGRRRRARRSRRSRLPRTARDRGRISPPGNPPKYAASHRTGERALHAPGAAAQHPTLQPLPLLFLRGHADAPHP